jgi:hypothetical protein
MKTMGSSVCRKHPYETEAAKIQFVDENIDYANRVVLGHVVLQMLAKQSTLGAVFPFDKAFHLGPVLMRYWLNVYPTASVYTSGCFYTAWVGCGHSTTAAIGQKRMPQVALQLRLCN